MDRLEIKLIHIEIMLAALLKEKGLVYDKVNMKVYKADKKVTRR